jgi:hypothetical protein
MPNDSYARILRVAPVADREWIGDSGIRGREDKRDIDDRPINEWPRRVHWLAIRIGIAFGTSCSEHPLA